MVKQTKPARGSRVEVRPDPRSWDMDELMTLKEAVDLHWPQGPITVPTLRTAIRDGKLAFCEIAGKFFLTRRLLLGLSVGRVAGDPPGAPSDTSGSRRRKGLSLEEARAIAGLPPQQARS